MTSPTLFAYGTLRHPRVISHVLGRVPASAAAELRGFNRYRVADAHFPGIIPEADSRIDGTLFFGITPGEWERLDRYESDLYVRQTVHPADAAGVSHAAEAYVIPDANRHLLTAETWHLAAYEPGSESF